MLLPRPDHAHMNQMDADILYYIASFISKSVKKQLLVLPVVTCVIIFEENSALEFSIEGMIPENCQHFWMR